MPILPIPLIAIFLAAGGLGAAAGLLITQPGRATVETGVDLSTGVPLIRRPPADRLKTLLPTWYRSWLEQQIVFAGRPSLFTMTRIVAGKPLLAILLGGFAFLLLGSLPAPSRVGLAAFALLLGFFTPDVLVYGRAVDRQQKLESALPDTLDQMTISVEAGLGFEASMAKAATNGSGPLAEELIRTLQDMSIGRTRRAAYEALATRTSSKDVRRFTRAINQGEDFGLAIADVLHVQASEMRLKRRQRAEEKAMKVPVKVTFPLIVCILPVLFIILLTPAALSIIKAFSG